MRPFESVPLEGVGMQREFIESMGSIESGVYVMDDIRHNWSQYKRVITEAANGKESRRNDIQVHVEGGPA